MAWMVSFLNHCVITVLITVLVCPARSSALQAIESARDVVEELEQRADEMRLATQAEPWHTMTVHHAAQ